MEQKWKICSIAEFPVSTALIYSNRLARNESGEDVRQAYPVASTLNRKLPSSSASSSSTNGTWYSGLVLYKLVISFSCSSHLRTVGSNANESESMRTNELSSWRARPRLCAQLTMFGGTSHRTTLQHA